MNDINSIKKHFSSLGYDIRLNKIPNSVPLTYELEYIGGPDPDRLITLCQYYFADNIEPTGYGECKVWLQDFNENGHEIDGICRKCGCTQHDACEDPDTGTCYWLAPDLCSVCGTPDQRAAAMEEMKDFFDD